MDPALLEILVCPRCKGDLVYDEAPATLTCHRCKLVYAIREGIPILLIDEATPLEESGS